MVNHRDVLHRFHQTLVRQLTSRQEWDLTAPLTVAEIYRDLVPPPIHKADSDSWAGAEYEQVLLRLLAGEGDYLRMESETAIERIREELLASNPDTGLYRDYARARVRLNPDRLEDGPETLSLAG